MLHRSAARPARYPKVMKPAELSPNAKRVAERGESVDVLQHEGRAGQVREQRRVEEPLVEDGAEEHPVGEQGAEVVQRVRESAAGAVLDRQRLAEHQQRDGEDDRRRSRRGRRTVPASR